MGKITYSYSKQIKFYGNLLIHQCMQPGVDHKYQLLEGFGPDAR